MKKTMQKAPIKKKIESTPVTNSKVTLKKVEQPNVQKIQKIEKIEKVSEIKDDAKVAANQKVKVIEKIPQNNKIPKPVVNANVKPSTFQAQEKAVHRKIPIQIKLLKQVEKDKKIVAVIISFMNGSSYDHLFTSVEQKSEQGTQVLVYSCNTSSIHQILNGFKDQSKDQKVLQMIQHIKSVDPDCVVFNWECCSHYSTNKFGQGKLAVIQFVRMMIDKGHMIMFSDFSLKALIAEWDAKILGPNPFVFITEFGGQFRLQFDCQKLKECPSAQLQIIGDMATQGHCNVTALGGTIVYGVDQTKSDNEFYKLQVLTIVTNLNTNTNFKSQINDKVGTAGHVLLTYKSGGHILVSMGHWIQLMKIDTSQKALFEVAENQFGVQRAKQMRMQYESLADEVQKKQYIAKNSVKFVQSQAPCKNMSKKARKGF